MDHKAFLHALTADLKAELTARNNSAALKRLAVLLPAMASLATIILMRLPYWGLTVPILGVLTAFLFTLQHECTHKTPFASSTANEITGHATGFLILQPFLWFRYFHLAHHKFTNDPDRDPELAGDAKPETMLAFALHLSSVLYWRDKFKSLAAQAIGAPQETFVPVSAQPRIRAEAQAMLIGYIVAAGVILAAPQLFWVWPGPLIFGFPVLRLYLLAEHGRCPTVANMFDNTRTTFTNGLVRLIAWNMPYHTEHHVFPSVPFHNLPSLNDHTREHLAQVEHGYGRFSKNYLATLRNGS